MDEVLRHVVLPFLYLNQCKYQVYDDNSRAHHTRNSKISSITTMLCALTSQCAHQTCLQLNMWGTFLDSLVQDCVFTRSLEFRFGARRKDRAEHWLGVRVWSLEKGSGLTLIRQVLSSEKERAEPWFGRFRVRRKEWAEPWFGRFGVRRKDRAEPWFGRFGVRRKEWAEPWLGRFEVGRKNLAEPWFGVWVRSLEKGTGRTLVRHVPSLEEEPFFPLFFFLIFFFSHFFFNFFSNIFLFSFFSLFFSFFSFFLLFFYFFFFFFILFYFFNFLLFFFLICFSFFFLFFGVRRKKPVFLRTPNLQNQGSTWSFLRTPNQCSALSFLRTPNLLNQGSAQFLLRTSQGLEFGERNWPNSEPAKPGL